MRILSSVLMALALIAAAGCWNTNESRQGGVASVDEAFSISVPSSSTVKQGTESTIVATLNRGDYFKQDVQLAITADGVNVSPASIMIKASDSPNVPIKIMTDKHTALGKYRVSVKGTPSSGLPASTICVIEVVAL